MAKATQTFHAWDSETATTRVFEEGDPVPDHVARTVGAHVLDKPVDADVDEELVARYEGSEGFEEAVDARAEQVATDRVNDALAAQREREQAAYDAVTSAEEPFDPTADGVKAADVKAYLEGLDRDTVAGSAEYDRVVEAEQNGENRKSAFPADTSGD